MNTRYMSFLVSKVVPSIRYQYTVRVSKRAKYMRLRVSLQNGVEVVVPSSMTSKQLQARIADFVREQQPWIDSVLKKLRADNQAIPTLQDSSLPERIPVPGLAQDFNVKYPAESETGDLSLWHCGDFELQVQGDISNKKEIFTLFEQFFKHYAYAFLQARLDEYSQTFLLPYQRLTVRAQKTRWGSCSSKRNISLNYRLIFLPEELMDYVILHELAHLRHMNHSRRFWALLESMVPNAREKDKQLNQAAKHLPYWMMLA